MADEDEALVGESHAVGVATEVLQYLLRASPGRFGIDHPREGVQLLEEGNPSGVLSQRATGPGKGQAMLRPQPTQPSEILASEDVPEGLYGKQKAAPTGAPLPAIGTQASTRDHAVDMDMLGERLAPCVKDRSDTEFCP